MPAVSVIVPTYNRSAIAAKTLSSLGAVQAPRGGFEVIVVDDGSSEDHAVALQRSVGELQNATLVRRVNGGPAAARNSGIREAASPLIAFLDDDCSPSADWLARLLGPFDAGDASLGAVGGRVAPAPPETRVQRFCSAIEYATGTQPIFENASTQNCCYRRDVLEQVGAFDEGFRRPGGDDPDLSFRTTQAGFRLEYVPEAVVYHSELQTYRDFLRHMYHRGLGEARIGRKFGRHRRVALRILLWPVFLAKIGFVGWRRTRGKGSRFVRATWLVLEQGGYAAFVVGSAIGFLRER